MATSIDMRKVKDMWGNDFDGMEIVEHTTNAVLFHCGGDYYAMLIRNETLAPIGHPYFAGLDHEALYTDDVYALTKKEAQERWQVWKAWEEEAQKMGQDTQSLPAISKFLYLKGDWPYILDGVLATSDQEYLDLSLDKKSRGGARPGSGRKAGVYGPDGKSIRRQVCLPEADWAAIDKAADSLSMTKSAFMREAARRYIADLQDKKH